MPCLNEEAVIASTVGALRDPAGGCRVVVVDDGSDDATGELARAAGGDQVTVVRRELPLARQGKGAALNAGFRHVVADVAARGLDARRVIVCVMDADGRLSDGALGEVLPLFDDASIGGVQLPVRIRNRSTNLLLQFQDYQFWTQSALTQFGRVRTSSVSLGGNGQFTRFSALIEVGQSPWTEALTEDLDLTISLAVRGWHTSSTARAAVDQQGVEKFGALVRQRTRWYQGHMMAARRLPEVFTSQRMSTPSAIEVALYLIVPWAFDLPWSILYHLVLIEVALTWTDLPWHAMGVPGAVGYLAVWYVLGFWPALVTAAVALRRDPDRGLRWAITMGHAFVLTNYLSYLCVWKALFRIVRGEHGWTKTVRVTEADTAERGQPAP